MPYAAKTYNADLLSEENIKKFVLPFYNLNSGEVTQVKFKDTEKQRAVYKINHNDKSYCLKKNLLTSQPPGTLVAGAGATVGDDSATGWNLLTSQPVSCVATLFHEVDDAVFFHPGVAVRAGPLGTFRDFVHEGFGRRLRSHQRGFARLVACNWKAVVFN